jgi:NTE family protein
MSRKKDDGRRAINLALQGGGTHGAFTWGVLDRLLEDERIAIDGISGTSAGAMNGAVTTLGYNRGGPEGAREALDRFWRRLSELGWMSPVRRGAREKLSGSWNLDGTPTAFMIDQMSLLLSPYQINPFNISPVRTLLEETLDIAELRCGTAIKFFVTATNVRTGSPRTFGCADMSIDALLASACVPQFNQAVEINGEPYWDGGYMGNPTIFPLIYTCDSRDIMIVEVTPMRRHTVPRTAAEIVSRMNEITFNASLMRELRTLAFVGRLASRGEASGAEIDRLASIKVHLVSGGQEMEALGIVSQLNTSLDFLLHLRDLGRKYAGAWLDKHFTMLARRSSVDLEAEFL